MYLYRFKISFNCRWVLLAYVAFTMVCWWDWLLVWSLALFIFPYVPIFILFAFWSFPDVLCNLPGAYARFFVWAPPCTVGVVRCSLMVLVAACFEEPVSILVGEEARSIDALVITFSPQVTIY